MCAWITHKFPEYELDNTIKEDILEYCRRNSIDVDKISRFSKKTGGETDNDRNTVSKVFSG